MSSIGAERRSNAVCKQAEGIRGAGMHLWGCLSRFLSRCVGRPAPPQATAQGHPLNPLDLAIIFSTDFFFLSVNILAFSFSCPFLAATPPPKALKQSPPNVSQASGCTNTLLFAGEAPPWKKC